MFNENLMMRNNKVWAEERFLHEVVNSWRQQVVDVSVL